MGSEDLKLERAADKRLAREQHRQDRRTIVNASTDTRPHGDAALGAAIEPKPTGRFGLHAFTICQPPKREPFTPAPLVKRTPRVRPVDAVTEGLALRKRAAPLPTRTPLAAGAMFSGSAVDAPGKALEVQPILRPRGAEAIIAALRQKGITLALSADGRYVVPASKGGRMFGSDRDLITLTADLLRAHLAGAPLVCQVGPHEKGTDATAVSVAVGGCPVCAAHLAGGAS